MLIRSPGFIGWYAAAEISLLLDAGPAAQPYGHRFHHPQAITRSTAGLSMSWRLLAMLLTLTSAARIKEQVLIAAKALGGRPPDLDEHLLDESRRSTVAGPIASAFEQLFLPCRRRPSSQR